MERLTVSVVLELMNEAMRGFEEDNAHGRSKAGDAARTAARKAKSKAEGISDKTAREAVGLFEEAIVHSPRGWKVEEVTVTLTPEAREHGWLAAWADTELLVPLASKVAGYGRGERDSPATSDRTATVRFVRRLDVTATRTA